MAIAAAVLGGCSLRGGEGSIFGILIGTAILLVIQNMINLLGYPSSLADAITGLVIFFEFSRMKSLVKSSLVCLKA